jgi:hypothetical protein
MKEPVDRLSGADATNERGITASDQVRHCARLSRKAGRASIQCLGANAFTGECRNEKGAA